MSCSLITNGIAISDSVIYSCNIHNMVEKQAAGLAMNEPEHLNPDELWVFGYGSLMWKVDFPVIGKEMGFIKGFHRRFYQHSIDHRGTAEKPGRVVTLIPAEEDDPSAHVYGVAYRIADADKEDVIKHLDFREKNGYVRSLVDFFAFPEPQKDAPPIRRISIYVATQDNESFAGEIAMQQLADQVLRSRGPSGSNVEYVLRLADAMRLLFPGEVDEHLFELEAALRRMMENQENSRDSG